MTDKTKGEIRHLLVHVLHADVRVDNALAKICAIVAEEREGQTIVNCDEGMGLRHLQEIYSHHRFQKGRLIFVPEGEK